MPVDPSTFAVRFIPSLIGFVILFILVHLFLQCLHHVRRPRRLQEIDPIYLPAGMPVGWSPAYDQNRLRRAMAQHNAAPPPYGPAIHSSPHHHPQGSIETLPEYPGRSPFSSAQPHGHFSSMSTLSTLQNEDGLANSSTSHSPTPTLVSPETSTDEPPSFEVDLGTVRQSEDSAVNFYSSFYSEHILSYLPRHEVSIGTFHPVVQPHQPGDVEVAGMERNPVLRD